VKDGVIECRAIIGTSSCGMSADAGYDVVAAGG
jgi:hypothetical protein